MSTDKEINPEDIIGKLFEIEYKLSPDSDYGFVIPIALIQERPSDDFRIVKLYFPNSMEYRERMLVSVINAIKSGRWKET